MSIDTNYREIPVITQYVEREDKKEAHFIIGEKIKVNCHLHIMTYMKRSFGWSCDGRNLPSGCYSEDSHFNSSSPRYRCNICDFDLCDKCVVKYINFDNMDDGM